jgi:PhnB protein
MSKYPKVVPHLVVKGGLEAIKFYEDALDAEAENVMMAQDGKRVMHAELEINDGTVFLCDEFPEFGSATTSPKTAGSASVAVHLEFKKPKHVDRMIDQAAEHGAEIIMPPADMFWGARYGRIRDPFGHVWSLGAPIKNKQRKQEAEQAEAEELEAEPDEAVEIPVPAKPSRKSNPKSRARGA